jgi:putative holliday junction resolvase
MRYLGIDFGTKRIGLAVGEDHGFGATPLATLLRSRSRDHDLSEVVRLATKEHCEAIVLGLPLHADGSHSPTALLVERWAAALGEKTTLPIHFQNEFLSSQEAETALSLLDYSRQKRKEKIDQVAAVQILESYLDDLRIKKAE